MDIFFPHDENARLEFKNSAMQIGFEELAAECTANMHLLQSQDRLTVLLMAWQKIGDYLTRNQFAPCVGSAVKWVGRYTLDLWFGRDWIACSTENKTSLIEHMMKVYPAAYITMHPYSWPYMFSIYCDPWMVEYLNVNFQRMNEPDTDGLAPKDSEFIQQEGISLIILRLINMFDFSMVKLVQHICLRLLWVWDSPEDSRSIRDTPNSAQFIDNARHIFLIAICESNGIKDLHYVLECIQRNMHCKLIESASPLERAAHAVAKGLQEEKRTLMEFLNEFLLKVPDTHYTNIFGSALIKYATFITEYQLRKLHSLHSLKFDAPYDNLYIELVKLFIKQRESSDELMTTTAMLAEKLFSAVHNLEALKFAYEIIKLRTRSEWYTTKLTLLLAIISEELNKLEDRKYTEEQGVDDLIAKEQELATFYKDLSKLLVKVPYLEQESWLTAFSLHPCKEYLEQVTKCGSRNLRAIKKQAFKLNPPKAPVLVPPPGQVAASTPALAPAFASLPMSAQVIGPALVISQEIPTLPSIVKKEIATQLQAPPEFAQLPTEVAIKEPCTSAAYLATLHKEEKEEDKPEPKPHVETTLKAEKKNKKRGPRPKVEKSNQPKPVKSAFNRKRGRPIGAKGNPKTGEITIKETKEEKAIRKSLKIKPIIATASDRDKDLAENIYSAAAGASDRLSSQTEDSLRYPTFALINSVTDTEDLIKFTDYDDETAQYNELNRLLANLRLQISISDDVFALIVSPRYKRLTWAICWKILRKRCRELITKESKKKQLVQQYMADANERLTHLDIDYDRYKDKPQIDYGTIEHGYECFDSDSDGDDTTLKPILGDSKDSAYKSPPKKAVRRRKHKSSNPVAKQQAVSLLKPISEAECDIPKMENKQEDISPEAAIDIDLTETKLSSPIYLSQPLYICRSDTNSPRLQLTVCPNLTASSQPSTDGSMPQQRSPIQIISDDKLPLILPEVVVPHQQQQQELQLSDYQKDIKSTKTEIPCMSHQSTRSLMLVSDNSCGISHSLHSALPEKSVNALPILPVPLVSQEKAEEVVPQQWCEGSTTKKPLSMSKICTTDFPSTSKAIHEKSSILASILNQNDDLPQDLTMPKARCVDHDQTKPFNLTPAHVIECITKIITPIDARSELSQNPEAASIKAITTESISSLFPMSVPTHQPTVIKDSSGNQQYLLIPLKTVARPIPVATPIPVAEDLVTTSKTEIPRVEQTAHIQNLEDSIVSASSTDDILHDEGKVFNFNLLNPHLKTYNRGAKMFEKRPSTSTEESTRLETVSKSSTDLVPEKPIPEKEPVVADITKCTLELNLSKKNTPTQDTMSSTSQSPMLKESKESILSETDSKLSTEIVQDKPLHTFMTTEELLVHMTECILESNVSKQSTSTQDTTSSDSQSPTLTVSKESMFSNDSKLPTDLGQEKLLSEVNSTVTTEETLAHITEAASILVLETGNNSAMKQNPRIAKNEPALNTNGTSSASTSRSSKECIPLKKNSQQIVLEKESAIDTKEDPAECTPTVKDARKSEFIHNMLTPALTSQSIETKSTLIHDKSASTFQAPVPKVETKSILIQETSALTLQCIALNAENQSKFINTSSSQSALDSISPASKAENKSTLENKRIRDSSASPSQSMALTMEDKSSLNHDKTASTESELIHDPSTLTSKSEVETNTTLIHDTPAAASDSVATTVPQESPVMETDSEPPTNNLQEEPLPPINIALLKSSISDIRKTINKKNFGPTLEDHFEETFSKINEIVHMLNMRTNEIEPNSILHKMMVQARFLKFTMHYMQERQLFSTLMCTWPHPTIAKVLIARLDDTLNAKHIMSTLRQQNLFQGFQISTQAFTPVYWTNIEDLSESLDQPHDIFFKITIGLTEFENRLLIVDLAPMLDAFIAETRKLTSSIVYSPILMLDTWINSNLNSLDHFKEMEKTYFESDSETSDDESGDVTDNNDREVSRNRDQIDHSDESMPVLSVTSTGPPLEMPILKPQISRRRKSLRVEAASRRLRTLRKMDEETDIEAPSPTNDSDDGSDYIPDSKHQRISRPIRLRSARKSFRPEVINDSSSCSSTATRRSKRHFAVKSTANQTLPVHSTAAKGKSSKIALNLKMHRQSTTLSQASALLLHKCVEVRVHLTRLTFRQAEMCRKPHVRVLRYPIEKYFKNLKNIEINSEKDDDNDNDGNKIKFVDIAKSNIVEIEDDADDEHDSIAEDPLNDSQEDDSNIGSDSLTKKEQRKRIAMLLAAGEPVDILDDLTSTTAYVTDSEGEVNADLPVVPPKLSESSNSSQN